MHFKSSIFLLATLALSGIHAAPAPQTDSDSDSNSDSNSSNNGSSGDTGLQADLAVAASPKIVFPPSATVSVKLVVKGSTTSEIPAPPSQTPNPKTLGYVNRELDRAGNPSIEPLGPTDVPVVDKNALAKVIAIVHTTAKTVVETGSPLAPGTTPEKEAAPAPMQPDTASAEPAIKRDLRKRQNVANIFTPISTNPPPAVFTRRRTHPVSKTPIQDTGALQTNKFYANLFLGERNSPVYTMPYELWWSNQANDPWGLSFDHREQAQQTYGPTQSNGATEYYINPIWIRSLSLSAVEFSRSTSSLELKALAGQSVDLMFYANKATSTTTRRMDVTLCQGMGFVSAMYYGLTPAFDSSVLVRSLVSVPYKTGAVKYRITLENNAVWLLYAWRGTSSQPLDLKVANNGRLEATRVYSGLVQFAKLSNSIVGDLVAEVQLDAASGAFCRSVAVAGQVAGSTGSYQHNIVKAGYGTSEVLMYALPHHIKSFEAATTAKVKTALKLYSGTKGVMTGVVANQWRMVESGMPTNIGWLPVRSGGTAASFTAANLNKIAASARLEIAQNMSSLTDQGSIYFSGKPMAKFAYVCLTASEVLKDATLTRTCLGKLKTAFARYTSNQQRFPLVYEDSVWRGIVSDAIYQTGDPLSDFGSGYYNDHHFHYGYFIQAAAIIGMLDRKHVSSSGTWTTANRDWVNSLVRDVANPSSADPYYPVFRAFDWFHGHSWAKGLFPSLDGKDEESSSEDFNFAYAMKLWGNVAGDAAMEARGNLMLAVMKRSMNEYMLISTGNTNHPANFVGNKLSGILFENKVHHTTYFGTKIEYIHGVHMLPLTPISSYIRGSVFPKQEWDTYFSNGRTTTIDDGWRGILWANVALWDPRSSFKFFNATTFQDKWLDGGASKTWYLAFSGALGGAATNL